MAEHSFCLLRDKLWDQSGYLSSALWSAPPMVKAVRTPVWVQTPGYRITPSEVGDTLSMPADSRQRYERFMTDTRLLLGL